MARIHIYYKGNDGKKTDIIYTNAIGITAGRALDILGKDDCDGNGIPHNAPLVQIQFDDGNTATFDADNVGILL